VPQCGPVDEGWFSESDHRKVARSVEAPPKRRLGVALTPGLEVVQKAPAAFGLAGWSTNHWSHPSAVPWLLRPASSFVNINLRWSATLGGTAPGVFISVPTRLILEPIGGLHYHGSPCNFLNQKTLRLT
jgi:hypothetical protein